MKLSVSFITLVMVAVASTNPVPNKDDGEDTKIDPKLKSGLKHLLSLTKVMRPKDLLSLTKGMGPKDILKLVGRKSLGQLLGPHPPRKLNKLLSHIGPLETAFATAAGFTTMAGIHHLAASREQASKPNAEEWEVVHSVWMDMLQKDLEDTWLGSKPKKYA